MPVLVAYGSKMGGTQGLAEMLGSELRSNGLDAEVVAASSVRDIEPYDAVIIGGALYAMRWHKDARRFVRRHGRALRQVPVWVFSSGPLDDSARTGDIPPVRFVRKAMDSIEAAGHMTFGGRIAEDATGPIASAMAKQSAGDWRDPDHVREWVKLVAESLQAS
jgi:menaquinone-dependent protoporphyrinogen oxidase